MERRFLSPCRNFGIRYDAVFFRGSGWKVGKGLGGIGNGLLGGLARGVELEKPLGALDFWRGILRWRIVGHICGSTKGIGLAIPSQLAAEGARVIVNVRSASAIHSDWEQVRKVVPEVKVDGFAGILATTTALKPCGSFSRGGLSGRKFSSRGFLR
jgi:hypothetical protein